MACIFLACKVEENLKSVEEIVESALAVRNNDKPLNNAQLTAKFQDVILMYERIVLCTLSFDLSVDHPHKHLDRFVRMLSTGQSREQYELLQASWNIVNDSLATTMCLRYSPRLIAAAAVTISVQLLSARLTSQANRPRFLEVIQRFEKSGKLFDYPLSELQTVEDEMLKYYETSQTA